MGPKRDPKRDAQKRDQNPTIEDPINTDSWRCAVMMAVERTPYDSFALNEFNQQFATGRRHEVGLIDFDTVVVNILKNFAKGDLHHKYLSLLNFSPILQEASDYVTNSTHNIPAPLLAKVVKAFLFCLREDSLLKIEKKAAGPPDPILAMAERPPNFGPVDTKKKEPPKKPDNAPKLGPPADTKQDTKLLKRGEPAKNDQRIDDAPLDGYFNLYVLLTGFYDPDLPLELLKKGVPLHGLLCVDTSHTGVTPVNYPPTTCSRRSQKNFSERKPEDIYNFWDVFLKILWDPQCSPHFKDTIFQVYVPRGLGCERKKPGEFFYREISYLMYDLSDLKRKLNEYLGHMKLRDVEEKEWETLSIGSQNIPNECASVPVVLQYLMDAICGDERKYRRARFSSDSIDSMGSESSEEGQSLLSLSAKGCWHGGSHGVQRDWSQALAAAGNSELLRLHVKIKELDVRYNLTDIYFRDSEGSSSAKGDSEATCEIHFESCGENMEQALAKDGTIRSYWKKYETSVENPFVLDYCLYPLLMTRVCCPYLANLHTTPPPTTSRHFFKKPSNFQLIQDLDNQMRKPHFTVTDSSRSILKALPYNVKDASRDFFSPPELKLVSPEKLKASSAPQFRVLPALKLHTTFASEMFSRGVSKNLFLSLQQFLGDAFFPNTNDFDFLELLAKAQLLHRQATRWHDYNCIDHTYSLLNDCIFIALHNRMDSQDIHHETFNQVLRTTVGLRDFFEYVLEDEARWFAARDESSHLPATTKDDSSGTLVRDDFTDSDFWLVDSIKYRESSRAARGGGGGGDAKDAAKATEKAAKGKSPSGEKVVRESAEEAPSWDFEGYNVSDMAVQLSGLRTVYYSHDCSMTVELIERLYGDQDLGIHITADGHTLHLYSYVCPEPHIRDPFTFHLTCRNGIVLAFSRRFVETFEEVEEIIESRTAVKAGKKNSSEVSTRVVKRLVPKTLRDEDFVYDMAASLPNGLSIRIVRRTVQPCYIAQRYLVQTDDVARPEKSRLFLPNGNVVRMLGDGSVQVLKPDTSTVTASLADLVKGETEGLHFARFRHVSPEGYASTFENGRIASSNRFQVLQNTDFSSEQVFFRRRDGTNYVLQSDGALCTEFKDGTKIFSSVLVRETAREPPQAPQEDDFVPEMEPEADPDPDHDFLFVYTKIVMEHPDYATVSYDTHTKQWTILLPQDSAITVDPDGQYSVDIDGRTDLRAEDSLIQMNRYSRGRALECAATADLSVFDTGDGGVYCHMEDLKGKIFIVEANSNCYILDDERVSDDSELEGESPAEAPTVSEFVASADLESAPSVQTEKCNNLSRSNKYFAIRRDMTAFELLHADDVCEALSEKKPGSLVFTETIPDTENRLFVLITPDKTDTCKKWQVPTILPNPRYTPNANKNRTSSTYGCPPSWMHPFPKRKSKFQVPQPLTCRLFLETRTTQLSPSPGQIDCYFCEMDQLDRPTIPPDGVQDYLTRLSNNDQYLLTEMYAYVAGSLINEKKKLKPVNSDKLDHYLCLSRYLVDLQEYHKRCIRYHTVPDYFHHPAGMSWLILNDLLDKLPAAAAAVDPAAQVPPLGLDVTPDDSRVPSRSTTAFSNEEIEYNLTPTGPSTFSQLTYRSDLSACTAPPVLRTAGLCTCKLTSKKPVASAPVVRCYWEDGVTPDDLHGETPPPATSCDFHEKDLEDLDKVRSQWGGPMTLEDLMCLGLV